MEARPSFSPPRHDLRMPDEDPGATEVYSQRLDTLNNRFEKLLELLTQRLRIAIEASGNEEDLVSTDKQKYSDSLSLALLNRDPKQVHL